MGIKIEKRKKGGEKRPRFDEDIEVDEVKAVEFDGKISKIEFLRKGEIQVSLFAGIKDGEIELEELPQWVNKLAELTNQGRTVKLGIKYYWGQIKKLDDKGLPINVKRANLDDLKYWKMREISPSDPNENVEEVK